MQCLIDLKLYLGHQLDIEEQTAYTSASRFHSAPVIRAGKYRNTEPLQYDTQTRLSPYSVLMKSVKGNTVNDSKSTSYYD